MASEGVIPLRVEREVPEDEGGEPARIYTVKYIIRKKREWVVGYSPAW
jgi:hypothetical protein